MDLYIENTALAFTILKKLVKMGIRESIFPFDGHFYSYELDQIESLVLTSNDFIDGIENLKNLKSLYILGNSEISVENQDYSQISNLKKLEHLQIMDDYNIKEIDLKNLRNLKRLRLVNNENLCNIKNISNLTNLEEVIICGNNIKSFDNVKDYIENTKNTKVNVLDFNMFHLLFGINKKNRKHLESKVNSGWSNISFGEMLYFDNECYKIDYYQMLALYNKALSILSRLKIANDSKVEIITKIYKYLVNNLTYDYDGIDVRNEMYKNKELYQDKDNEYFKRRMLSINSSYSAIMEKKTVCDGYVNMMRLLLNIFNIDSKKVSCSFYDSDSIKPDHVILKVYLDGEWLYLDPEKEEYANETNYFLLTIDEIQKTHRLPSLEIQNYNAEKEKTLKLTK